MLSTIHLTANTRVSPGFALIDQSGATITNEDLRGDIVVIGLASLDCDDTCEATLGAMKQAAQQFSNASDDPDQPDIRLMTIIVDPVEQPNVLESFAEQHDLVEDRWSIVSGSESVLRAVVGSGFEVYLAKRGDGALVHDPAVFLTDHAGFLRAEYRTGSPRAATISEDIDRVLAEANAGKVGGILYNAAHSLSLSCGG
ncbi:MAG: SCO family protein [Thermomicrobiales bacterium]